MKAIPDLLIHELGPDRLNLVVLEAKTAPIVMSGAVRDQDAVRRDLGKLALFGVEQHLGYRRRVFLVSGLHSDVANCVDRMREFGTQSGSKIVVLVHDLEQHSVCESGLLQDPQWCLNYLLGKESITHEQAKEFGYKAEIMQAE